MSPVLTSANALDAYLGFANPIYSTLNDTATSSTLLYPSSPSPLDAASLVKRLSHEASIVVAQQSARQKAATLSFVESYQFIIVGIVGLLTLRNLVLMAARNNRKWRLVIQKLDELHMEKMGQKGMRPLGHRAPTSAKIDSVLFYPLTSKWWLGLENPLQLFLLVASVAINAGFILVSLCLLLHSAPNNFQAQCFFLDRPSRSNGTDRQPRSGIRFTSSLSGVVGWRWVNSRLSSLCRVETRSSNS